MARGDGTGRGFPLRALSLVALLLALVFTGLAVWSAHSVVRDQENRLLKERASEVNLVLASAVNNIETGLAEQGALLKATDESVAAYNTDAQRLVKTGPGKLTLAWLRPQTGGGYVVIAAAGDGLHTGDVVTDARVQTFDASMRAPHMVATPVFGPQRILGFALSGAAAPAGTVLYRESALGPVAPPRAASTAPFAELEVVIYGSATPQASQVLAATSRRLPLRGEVRNVPLPAGSSHWLLSVKAKDPLVGSVANNAPWIALIAGLVGSLLIGAVIEIAARRRDAALALYAVEHHVAETLQRSLLPQLPSLPGLDLAARYLASGSGQQVGGDWFDVFPLSDGRVGLAVGDVIGHDLAAATAMAQIRASLRAFALGGEAPATVVNQLDHLVDAFGLTQLVTVVYGLLDLPAADGSRLLRYTNAGHLPPILRHPDGRVESLGGGDSVVIGAPITVQHVQAEQLLLPGSTLVMFTDGLVEVPGQPLDEALRNLSNTISSTEGLNADAMCEQVIATTSHRSLRDDVALLAVRLTDPVRSPAGASTQVGHLVEGH